jgi:hypothetical protein
MAQQTDADAEESTLETLIDRSRTVEVTVTESVKVTHKRGTAPRDQNKVTQSDEVSATFLLEDDAPLDMADAVVLSEARENRAVARAKAQMETLRAHDPDAEDADE